MLRSHYLKKVLHLRLLPQLTTIPTGLKILWSASSVRVRVPPPAPCLYYSHRAFAPLSVPLSRSPHHPRWALTLAVRPMCSFQSCRLIESLQWNRPVAKMGGCDRGRAIRGPHYKRVTITAHRAGRRRRLATIAPALMKGGPKFFARSRSSGEHPWSVDLPRARRQRASEACDPDRLHHRMAYQLVFEFSQESRCMPSRMVIG
jgi:hypothetical protein